MSIASNLYTDSANLYGSTIASDGAVVQYTDPTEGPQIIPSIVGNAGEFLQVNATADNIEWTSFTTGGGLPVNQVNLGDGTQAQPSLCFQSDLDLGLYRANPDHLRVVANNDILADFTTTHFRSRKPFHSEVGSVSAPTYTFESDTDTGIYQPSSNQLAIGCNGGITANFTTTTVDLGSVGNARELNVTGSVNATGWCRTGNGTAALPVFTFTADQDSGMYRIAANQVGISAGGIAIASFSNTGVDIVGNFITTVPAALTGASINWNDLTGSAILLNTSNNNIQLNLNNSGGITSIGRTIKFYKSSTSNNLVLASTGGNVRLNSPWGTDVANGAAFTSIPSMSGRQWLFEITRSDANIYNLNSILLTDNLNTFQAANSLTVTGTCNANIFRAGDGTAAIPSYSFTNATGTDCGLTYNPYLTTDRIYMNLNGARVQMWNAATGCEIFQDTKIATEVGGARNLTVAGNIYNSLGTNSLPSYSFTGDTTTGIYLPALNQLAITTNGVLNTKFTTTGVDIGASGAGNNRNLLVNGSIASQTDTITGNVTFTDLIYDNYVVDTSGGNRTISLGTANPTLFPLGRSIRFYKSSASNSITIASLGSIRLYTELGVQVQSNSNFTNTPTNSSRFWLFEIIRINSSTYSIKNLWMSDNASTFTESFSDKFSSDYLQLQRDGYGAYGATTPSLYFENDTDTGIYSSAANTINFTTGGNTIAKMDVNGFFMENGITGDKINAKTSNFTITINDSSYYTVDCTGGAITMTLPTGIPDGSVFYVTKLDSTNAFRITTAGSLEFNHAGRTNYSWQTLRGYAIIRKCSSTKFQGVYILE